MILPFSTKINGKPTRFVEKIVFGLYKSGIISLDKASELLDTPISFVVIFENQKLHTIREDKNNRWKAGVKIDFFINCRQKNMFRFAPVLPVISTQEIEINWFSRLRLLEVSKLASTRYNYVEVIVDSKVLTIKEIQILSQNDGFDTVEDFFLYFNKNFKGKIIHWTDLKY